MHNIAWSIVVPVPADAPPPPQRHAKLGTPSGVWIYRDRDGAVLGQIARFDRPDGKTYLPLTLWRGAAGGFQWRWKAWPCPRPLYGLDRLAARPEAPVLVCEGEKAADAAAGVLPGWVATCAPNGAGAAGNADWRPLAGREVTIWPDADEPGHQYAASVAKTLATAGAKSVSLIDPPAAAVAGWDAADALAEGWEGRRVQGLVRGATPVGPIQGPASTGAVGNGEAGTRAPSSAGPAGRQGGRARMPSQSHKLVRLAEDLELWHTPRLQAYATLPVNGHAEHRAVRSWDFRRFLSGACYDAHVQVPSSQALEDALRVVEMLALRGAQHTPHVRVGQLNDALYLDLGDRDWRVVEVTAAGWQVIDKSPVKFVRSDAMKSLPEPEGGTSIDSLREFVNVASDDDFQLIVGFLIGAFHPHGPFPLLLINGEQGTAKSMMARILVSLIDPRAAPLRSFPRDERDLSVFASNARLLAFDNISMIPYWLSDALCRLSTGGGFGTRQLHSDREEVIFDAQRPIILNGIPDLASRPDLGDRAIAVTLSPIPPEARRAESELLRAFEAARPEILGALLDGVSSALRNRNTVQIERLERMADFCLWVTAAEPGLGWEDQTFMNAYRANRTDAVELGVENDPAASAVRAMMDKRTESWEGSASELLLELASEVSERLQKTREWPQTPVGLASRLRRVMPMLRQIGIEVEMGMRSPSKDRKRLIRICRGA
jgi:hypothetical protein